MDVQHLIQTEDGQLLWYDPTEAKTYRIVETLSNEVAAPEANPEIESGEHQEEQEHILSSCEITAAYDPQWKACEPKDALSTPHQTETDVDVQQGQQELLSCETTASSVKNIWDEPQTLLLLEQCKKWKDDINNPRVKKMDVYKKIACEMRKYNHQFTWLQCQNRMKTLLTKYKEIRDHLSTTGSSARKWAYYDIMLDYIGDRPNVTPTSSLSTLQLQKQTSESEAGVSPSSATTSSSSIVVVYQKRKPRKELQTNRLLEIRCYYGLSNMQQKIKEKEQRRLEVLEKHHQENKELFNQFLEAINAQKK